jgi:hypothetical protein
MRATEIVDTDLVNAQDSGSYLEIVVAELIAANPIKSFTKDLTL